LQEIERLKVSRNLDSSNSSKPPSQDIHKKSENKKVPPQEESNQPKKKPGGQPGHQGIVEGINQKIQLIKRGLMA
jgi:transposase